MAPVAPVLVIGGSTRPNRRSPAIAAWVASRGCEVSYGSHGGDKCARQLREILGGLDMRLTAAMPGLRLSRDRIAANDGAVDPERDFAEQSAEIDEALRELAELWTAGSTA